MEWSTDEIKLAIANNKISAITLDTSVFDGNGNRFEHGLLPRLAQFKTTDVAFSMLPCVARAMRSRVQAGWLTPYVLKPFPRHHNVAITVLRHFSGTNVAIQLSRQEPAWPTPH
jgi:hypothetical protein